MSIRTRFGRRLPLPLILAGASVWAFGCGGDGPTDPSADGEQIAVIEVTPAADTLTALGDTVGLDAVARDADGNVVPGVAFTWSTSDDAVATVSDSGVVEALGNGLADITASAEGVTGSTTLAVAQRVATLTVSPASVTLTTVGATQQFTASATDANGNAVEGAQYVWASEDHTVATVDPNGLATAKGSGEATITGTAQDIPGHATLTVDQQIDHVAFLVAPATTTAGMAFDPAIQVEVRDADGQRVEDAGTAITLAIAANAGGGTLAGTKTVNAINGVASFSGLWIDKAAAGYTLAAAATAITPDTSAAFEVTPAAPVALAFRTPPADSVTAGDSLGLRVAIVDEFDNTVTSASDTVTIALADGPAGGVLVGDTAEAAVGGVATFDSASIELAGSGYVLDAAAPGFPSTTTDLFSVVAAPPHHLALGPEGIPFAHAKEELDSLRLVVEDTFGNLVDTSTAQVSVAIDSGYAGASLEGELTVSAVDGVAHFDSAAIDKPGDYRIRASSSGIAATTSIVNAFMLLSSSGLTGGGAHTCMSTRTGPFCWGSNGSGQLGGPTASTLGDSVAVAGEIDLRLAAIAAGTGHTCGITGEGAAYCWGDNASGQLGDGNLGTDQPTPSAVGGTTTFRRITAGDQHTCAVGTDSLAYCWGANDQGQLGTGTAGPASDLPVLVTDSITFISVHAGDNHTCGWGLDSLAYCWGDNADGQLGDGNLGTDSPSPVAVQGGITFGALDAGSRHSCGVAGGTVYCWGANDLNQLGTGTTDSDTPVSTETITSVYDSGSYFGHVAAGGGHTCVIKSRDLGMVCWGDNSSGQLGLGTTGGTDSGLVLYSDNLEWVLVIAGGAHTCAYAEDQDGLIEPDAGGGLGEGLHCWGANGNGQLGDGSTADSNTLSRVVQGF